MTHYVFDNADTRTKTRFAALAAFDPASHAALAAAGVAPGWTCWEVGGGDGSIGHWLSEQVGAGGSVLVTDIDPRWIPAPDRPDLTVRRHDVVTDELPGGTFDLIHARLVLIHLPDRQAVLDRLVSALKPGGRLVVEEFDLRHPLTPRTADPHHVATFDAVHAPLLGVFESREVGATWARSLPDAFIARGLQDVRVDTTTALWRGGSEEIELHRVNVEQLAEPLAAAGVSPRTLAAFYALLEDPAFAVWSYPLVSVTGTRG
ncbi:class I SAM-dependent methyltransferase [Actinokineospora globicatena]|uniref:class I SAM-dependent methyltransferase n=1 Tax=Actinokineospora globicatena TaxID=103729 RepID=UPI0020A25EDE|nr:class I SAM-dependent methyltransferase [Actinokineospora globicatena]MCP2303116.1 Ubiquinone/menaquinone biosynthesis C-methylase UbiE [Actinokineospora globicatena]